MLRVVSLFLLIFTVNSLSQTSYYVSSSQGNDLNSGTTQATPWATLEKVNSIQLNPGDQILFRAGDTWQGVLNITSSGTEQSRIYFKSYGAGEKPIITLRSKINRNWVQNNQSVWYIETPVQLIPIERIWLNGIEKEQAKDAWSGNNWDGTYGVCPEHPFYHDSYGGKLYIYATADPNTIYSNIEYQGGLLNDPVQSHTVQLIDADYITLDGLDIQGGGYSALGLAGSDYAIIKNCRIGKYSGRAGIFANSNRVNWLANDRTSDFGKIYDCEINSYWNYTLKFYTSHTPYGIVIGWGASSWEIYNNYIKDWWFGIYTGTGEIQAEKSFYHKIFGNEITAPNFSYGKGIQITAWNLSETGFYTWCEIYNNYIHNIRAAGICISASGNKVYFNIIDSIDVSRCLEKGDQANSGMGMEFVIDNSWGINGSLDSNFVINNTFYRLNREAMNWNNPFVYNNLYLQTSMATNHALAVSQSSFRYRNNLFYKTGSTPSTTFIWKSGTSNYYSVSAFNNLGGNVSGNIYPSSSTLSQIMNNNYSLPAGSPALNAGIDISSLVPIGFRDRTGKLIDRNNPDLGAIQTKSISDLIPPRLISAQLMDATKLLLSFDEPMSESAISITSNYLITNGITVQSAHLNNVSRTEIILITSPHTYLQNYSITVSNLTDASGNVIQPSSNSAAYQNTIVPPPTGGLSKLTILSATASATNDINYGPDKTIDGLYFSNGGNPFSRWAAMPIPQWLIYDLGVPKQMSKTRIAFYEFENGRIYTFNIYVSNDSTTWVNVISNAVSSDQEWTENTFNSTLARYLKVEMVSNNQNTWATVWEVEIWGDVSIQSTVLNSKIFLQGPYLNGQMTTVLRDLSHTPLTQPFNNAPWNYNGSENVSQVPSGVVDWILLELRTDTAQSSSIAKRAVFIRNDGRLVDLDGVSNVIFNGVNNANYYLVISQRNHLSIMSAIKISLSNSSSLYDFTISPFSVFGNDLADLGNGNYGMYAGDADANRIVNVLDYSTVGNNLFQFGYKMGDLDLNGVINILDYGMTNKNLLKHSNVPGTIAF